ncbi:TerC family protein [Oleiagrimonas sp. C23AA]|uniref:TerC family protein n=1 Tax=Oleiagrimonas sp. C23AA TaxID=2719047 RepID=UPI00141F3977|nr:TerC family protein [Oleiagrimonas sp. C23AA]NII09306.1 TerC family protein [Oleiagrimonas sp. C23AA]
MFAFDWLADPTAWAGLFTLVVLEIVLGIDNLVFIAILADKLPARERDRARLSGLGLALLMRLVMLAAMSWLVRLTDPIVQWRQFSLSWRDIILVAGGLFLLFKATLELHDRLEGGDEHSGRNRVSAGFWVVVTQIVILDAVFSLDSVITAVGMVDHLSIMMIAVVIAMALMILASKPLTAFVNARPTVIILCLSFLLMIGFSLVAEGFGFHIPKGYLYAAIGFSILIEVFNQVARRNHDRSLFAGALTLRDRTSEAVLRMLGAGRDKPPPDDREPHPEGGEDAPMFGVEERAMVQGVLDLAQRPVRTIMTPRHEMDWLDIEDDADVLREAAASTHHWLPVARGDLDQLLGVTRARDVVADVLQHGRIDENASVRKPLTVLESLSVLRLIEEFRKSPLQVALVVDEYGSIEGIVTPTDVLEVIAGEFPQAEGEEPSAVAEAEGSWLFDGGIDLRRVEHLIERRLPAEDGFGSLAGFVLDRMARLPSPGDRLLHEDMMLEVVDMDGARIQRVRVSLMDAPEADGD